MWFWTQPFHHLARARAGAPRSPAPSCEEAIRPHVTGRFQDMVLAVMRHPAMLLYLDNAGSVGPDSPVGQRTHRGLNENLARECMELHTVSPAAGLHAGRCDGFRANPDRLVHRSESRPARLPVPAARARAGRVKR